jgi:hypothetical protein
MNEQRLSDGTLCTMNLVSAGLPHRTALLLERERQAFSATIASLFALGKGEITLPPLTSEVLDKALASKEPGRAYTAAFLIGRCRTPDTGVDSALTRRLEEILDETPEPDVAIETAMSLALRGRFEHGRTALRALLNSLHPLGDQYKAAFYLAQMGDPSGYGALVKTLHSEIPHYRLMALRHAIAFAPYEGQQINDAEIDVRKLLIERLVDPDELVRSEVPFYLEELAISDIRTLLQPVEQQDPSPSVRTAARIVLDRNR